MTEDSGAFKTNPGNSVQIGHFAIARERCAIPHEPGTYVVTLSVGSQMMTKPVTVLQDVWLNER